MLEIVRLEREREVGPFLDLAHRVYDGSPWPWVPPLRLQLRAAMGALQGRERGFFLALRDGRPVARLGATVHRYPGYEALHFGFYESLPGEQEATSRLLDAARQLAPHLMVRGPYQFRQEDFYTGLLTEGFDDAPSYGTAFNAPYYQELLTHTGLRSVMRLVTYTASEVDHRPELLRARAERARSVGVTVRSLNPWRRLRDIRAAVAVMNDTLRDNWGFEPIGAGQTAELYFLSLLFLDPQWLKLAEWQGKTAGTLILLPDCNPWLRESMAGGASLFPFLATTPGRSTIPSFACSSSAATPGLRESLWIGSTNWHCSDPQWRNKFCRLKRRFLPVAHRIRRRGKFRDSGSHAANAAVQNSFVL